MEHKQTLSVLVVEDSLFDRRLLETMLKQSSKQVTLLKSAESLKDAVQILKDFEIDVVILDLNLTDSYGEDTLRRLHAEFPNVAMVINTGAYEDETGLDTLHSGAQDFLVKGKYNAYLLVKTLIFAVERKRIEKELRQALAKIKDAQVQLAQAEKMKVVGGLASGVAHEVKNPLATILYGLTYLKQKFAGKDQKVDSVLKNMQESVERANGIIGDLLNFSSVNALSRETLHLSTVVKKAVDLVQHDLSRKKIILSQKIDKDMPEVNVDPNRIIQVLINLILNAVNVMPEGGHIKISGHNRKLLEDLEDMPQLNREVFQAGDHMVFITVDDEGSGIPEDKLKKIFDPFFTTRRGEGGVGLGLSVSKNIMDMHQGSIFLENRRSGGARATLVFKANPRKENTEKGGAVGEQKENISHR